MRTVVILLLIATSCLGNTINSASVNLSDVQAAVSSANPGDIVQVPAGSATWSGGLTIGKSITLQGTASAAPSSPVQGPGVSSTFITRGSGFSSRSNYLITISPSSDVPVRITGFHFDNGAGSSVPANNLCTVFIVGNDTSPIKQVRIDNCTFNTGSQVVWWNGGAYGVTDHCLFQNCWIGVIIYGGSSDLGDKAFARNDYAAGSANFPFTEDCIFIWNLAGYPGSPWVTYHWGGGRSVLRHCTIDSTGASIGSTGPVDCHGNQNYWHIPGESNQRGTIRFEFYNNIVKMGKGAYQVMDARGGSMIVHDNTFTTTDGDKPNIIDFRDEEDDAGNTPGIPLRSPVQWPCEDQITASFIWNNTMNGSPGKIGIGTFGDSNTTSGDPFYIKVNRDYWLSPPNGSTTTVYPLPPNGPTIALYPSPYANLQLTSYTPYAYPHPLTGASPTPTPSPSPSPTPTVTPTPVPTPTATPVPTPSPTATPTPSSTPSPTPTSTPSPTVTPTPSATPSAGTYTTAFPLTENPISEGGIWLTGKTTGLDWSDVSTTPGDARGQQTPDGPTYNDSTAILTGSWNPTQTASAVVIASTDPAAGTQEVELRLRSNISAHSCTGYEIYYSVIPSNPYLYITKWLGPVDSFSIVTGTTGSSVAVKTGDVVLATASGNTITGYINGVQKIQLTDSSFPTGNPGIGFYISGAGGAPSSQSQYGFSSFTATGAIVAPTPTPTPTPVPTPTATPTVTPTPTATPSPTATATPSPTISPTATPSATPTPSVTPRGMGIVQHNHRTAGYGSSISAVYGPETAGDTNIIQVIHPSAQSVKTVAGTNGNKYVLAKSVNVSSYTIEVWYAIGVNAGTETATISFTGSTSNPGICFLEASGISALDTTTGQAINSGIGMSSGFVTTSFGPELLFGGFLTGNSFQAPGIGWIHLDTDSQGDGDEYQIVASAGEYAATATQSSGSFSAAILAGFR